MKKWLRRMRGAVRMGFVWGIAWWLVGMLIELVHDVWPNPLGALVDIWPAALGIPAFLGGLTFSALLGIVGRRRRFEELSLPGFAALGALGGVLVSLGPALMVAVGFASVHGPYTVWQVTAPMMIPLALVGATSAAGSLMLARKAERLERLQGGEALSEIDLAKEKAAISQPHDEALELRQRQRDALELPRT
jgi:hypothetical protein